MTKEQMQTKLGLLPLLTTVTADYSIEDNNPRIEIAYDAIPGPGSVFLYVDLEPSVTQLHDIVNGLPLNASDKLAALAIMLVPIGTGT